MTIAPILNDLNYEHVTFIFSFHVFSGAVEETTSLAVVYLSK